MIKKILVGLLVSLCFLFTAAPVSAAMPFNDVKSSDWFYDDVLYAYENNLFSGVSSTSFAPSNGMTRGMFVTVLGRVVGIDPDDYYGSYFDDIDYDDWYYGPVYWAYENGIVTGTGNNQFSPNSLVTREQMATMIANYINKSGSVLPDSPSAVYRFNDSWNVSPWATAGLELMRRSAIIQGDTNGNFNPKQTATRAQCAAIFHRLVINRATNESNLGDTHVIIKGSYMAKGENGEDVLIVRVQFKNLGDENISFTVATMDYGFQNGVQLDRSFYYQQYESGYNDMNEYKDLQKGGEIEVQLAYSLNDRSPVTIEIEPLANDSGFKAVKTFSVQ